MKRKILLGAVATLWASAAAATNYASVGPAVPSDVILEGDQIYIRMDGIPNPDNCGHADVMMLTAASPAEAERMFSILITSITSGKTVTVWVEGCTSTAPWGGTIPNAYDVQLHR